MPWTKQMTTTPISPADAPLPRSAQQRRDFIGACIAWCVVIVCLSSLLGVNVYASSKRHKTASADVFNPAEAPSIEMLMTGRVAVGSKIVLNFLQGLQGMKPGTGSANLNIEANEQQVKELATWPLEKLRAAPVLGELGGKAAALAELDEIPPDSESYPSLAPDIRRLRVIYTRGPDALNDADRQALVDRHGWFGKLAVSFDRPDTDPARRAALAPAKRAAVASMVLGGIAVIAFVAGLVLAIIALVMFVQGRFRSAYALSGPAAPRAPSYMPASGGPGGPLNPNAPLVYFSPPPPPPVITPPTPEVVPAPPRGGPFVEAFAIYLGGQLLIGLLLRVTLKDPSLAWEWLLLLFIPIPILWPRFRGIGKAEWKRAIGWHTGRGAWIEIGSGALGYLAGLPVVAIGGLIAMLLGKLVHAHPTHPIVFEFGQGVLPVLQVFALACIWAPIVEETMFRGALFHHLRRFGKGWRWLPSALLVSFIFAAIHPQGWTFIPVLGALAFVFAGLREWRGSILTSATAHFMQNCFIVILMAGILG
jgi:membrane protease YdiL (CAAX protease family)